ncbi:hypothetical protein ACP4OV_028961 [Aristida adscensionis]
MDAECLSGRAMAAAHTQKGLGCASATCRGTGEVGGHGSRDMRIGEKVQSYLARR